MFDGQSLLLTPTTGTPSPQLFRASAHPTAKLTVASAPDTTFAERTATASWRVDHVLDHYPNAVLITDGGTSDIFDDMAAEDILTDLSTYVAARRAAGYSTVHGMTLTPSANFTGPEEAERVAYNAALVADPGAYGLDSVVDIAAIDELTDPDDGTYFADATGHYTQAAADIIAAALAASGA